VFFVIASVAKQSIIAKKVDCFVAPLLAMTTKHPRGKGVVSLPGKIDLPVFKLT
jgi:hypothetical protein